MLLQSPSRFLFYVECRLLISYHFQGFSFFEKIHIEIYYLDASLENRYIFAEFIHESIYSFETHFPQKRFSSVLCCLELGYILFYARFSLYVKMEEGYIMIYSRSILQKNF